VRLDNDERLEAERRRALARANPPGEVQAREMLGTRLHPVNVRTGNRAGSRSLARTRRASAVLLPSGGVLVAGGGNEAGPLA